MDLDQGLDETIRRLEREVARADGALTACVGWKIRRPDGLFSHGTSSANFGKVGHVWRSPGAVTAYLHHIAKSAEEDAEPDPHDGCEVIEVRVLHVPVGREAVSDRLAKTRPKAKRREELLGARRAAAARAEQERAASELLARAVERTAARAEQERAASELLARAAERVAVSRRGGRRR